MAVPQFPLALPYFAYMTHRLRLFALVAALGCAVQTAPSPTVSVAEPGPLNPRAPLTADQQKWVDSTLASLSLRQRVGQMVMVWMLGDYTNTHDSTYAELTRWVDAGIGGVSMSLGTPIEVAAKLNSLQRRASVPLLVSADLEPALGRLEGGLFAHYLLDAGGATVFPSAMAIAATGRDEDAYDVAKAIGREARAVGIQINFAPTVDVNNNPANPVINTRSFGEDPVRVARLSGLFVRGTQDGGAFATAKHFPGHGDTDVDSHVGLPIVSANRARLNAIELVPFKAAIDAGAGMVMTAHIALPAVQGDSSTPATLAPKIITDLLRDTLGFRGVAITDAMTMEGIGKGYTTEQSSVLAVKAGADILLKPSDPVKAIDAVVAAVERGEISRARIDSATRAVLRVARAAARRRRGAGTSRAGGRRCETVADVAARSRQPDSHVRRYGPSVGGSLRAGDGDQGGAVVRRGDSRGARRSWSPHRRRPHRPGCDARSARFTRPRGRGGEHRDRDTVRAPRRRRRSRLGADAGRELDRRALEEEARHRRCVRQSVLDRSVPECRELSRRVWCE